MQYSVVRHQLAARARLTPLTRPTAHWPAAQLLVKPMPATLPQVTTAFARLNPASRCQLVRWSALSATAQQRIARRLLASLPADKLAVTAGALAGEPFVLRCPANITEVITLPAAVAELGGALIITPNAHTTLTVIEPSFTPARMRTGSAIVFLDLQPGSAVHYFSDRRGDAPLVTSWQSFGGRNTAAHWTALGGGPVYDLLAITNVGTAPGGQAHITGVDTHRATQRALRLLTHHHRGRQTKGQVTWKATVNDTAETALIGWIKIDPTAAGTQSFLAQHALLEAPTAIAHTIPNLEIETNDVAASHSATVGSLDPAALQYAASRGLDPVAARGLLLRGWLLDTLTTIDSPIIQTALRQAIHSLYAPSSS